MTTDHMLTNGGEDVHSLLPEYLPVYSVGEWHSRITRRQTSSTCF